MYIKYASIKVPIILKKEDVFQHLYDHNVSLVRACWYIKMLALYHSANNDSKQKKRHVATDPYTEWTKITVDVLKVKKFVLVQLEYFLST